MANDRKSDSKPIKTKPVAIVLVGIVAALCVGAVYKGSWIKSTMATVDRPLSPISDRGIPPSHTAHRPNADRFWNSYQTVDYADHNIGQNLPEVWHTIGGTLGDEGIKQTWSPCAAELSYALNHSGTPIQNVRHASNRNSDNARYILSARLMRKYLWSRWGKPDYKNHGVFLVDPSSRSFLNGLSLGSGVAVFATDGHVGVIKAGYRDPILPTQGTADIWKLPS